MDNTFKTILALLVAFFSVIACEKEENQEEPQKEKATTCLLKSFSITKSNNGGLSEDIKFSKTNNTYSASYLNWIKTSSPEMMIPTFTHNGEKVLLDGEEIISGKSKISFAKDIHLIVVAENGNKSQYTISLVCPQINGELPVLHFYMDVNTITSRHTYLESALEMYSPFTDEGKWGRYNDKVQIRGRGNSTWGMPKKPYRIKFPKKFSPIGLNHCEAKSWVILAQDMDKSLLRNHLAFEASKIMFNPEEGWHDKDAIMFTPCSQLVNVYFNYKYHGVYQMSDQMERHKGRIEVDKLQAADGADAEKITGGYILETDIHMSESAPIAFNSSTGIRFNHKYPDDDDYDIAQFKYIEDHIAKAEAVLYSDDFKDKTKGWRKYFDEKTLADFIIVKEFVGDLDGYTSTYCYKRRGNEKIYFGPVWDCDKAWRNDVRVPDPEHNPTASLIIHSWYGMPYCQREDWYHRFWEDEDFRQLVKSRWDKKKAALQKVVYDDLKSMPAAMPKSIEANFKVWDFSKQNMDTAPAPASNYSGEIARIKNYTEARVRLLDQLFN